MLYSIIIIIIIYQQIILKKGTKMKLNFFTLLFISLFFIWNCASIVKGTKQSVSIDSNVQGAEIYFIGAKIGVTPFAGKIKKGQNKQIVIKKDGYVDKTVILSTSIEPWFWGNIITGGTLGSTTDFASGAAFQYSPATYYVNMSQDGNIDSTTNETGYLKFLKDTEIKKFVMINYIPLANELTSEAGEYTNTLLNNIFKMKKDSHSKTVKELIELLDSSNGRIVEFGETVANYYFDSVKS